MYNEYFGFKEAPFSIAPDPRYLYMTAQHRDALAHLVYGLNSEGGCILLTGEVGTGKTTICRCLLEQIPDQANVALVLNPKLSEIELLETICDELKIEYPDSNNTVKTYTDRIYHFLIETNRNNEKTVLIIDEAQNLDSKVLEQLRLLTNLETDQRKLLQIIILGQPELLDILARSEMRQLAQRITARFHLQPLNKSEVKAYLSHRLAVAGQNIQLFPDKSINLLYKLSNGVPRLINIISDRSLLGAYVENQYSANPSIVKKAAHEVFGELKNVEKSRQFKKWFFPTSAAAIISALVIGLFYFLEPSKNTITDTSAPVFTDNQQAAPPEKDIEDTAADELLTSIQSNQAEISAEPATEDKTLDRYQDQGQNETNIDTERQTENTAQVKISSIEFDDINDILNDPSSDRISAYQQLFTTWDQQYDSNNSLTACKQASAHALSCLFKQGNLNSLKTHNRPAVLKLINKQGEDRYITITSLQDNVATIFANNIKYRIELNILNQYWYGQFILLWKKPENYSAAILPGDNGNIVNWLQAQFPAAGSSADSNIYDDSLKTKVKNFQASHGLSADGIVGPVTIIHLNAQSGMIVPLLTQPG